jgi:hydroxymethylglutaryl-CoA reductase
MNPSSKARKRLADALSGEDLEIFTSTGGLTLEAADQMRENVIGVIRIPVGLVEGLIVNGRCLDVPIATEEQSVVAQASAGARFAALGGGFTAEYTGNIMRGQVQVLDVPDIKAAASRVQAEKETLLLDANTVSTTRKAVGLDVRTLQSAVGPMMVVELFVDVRDSMGANLVDSMCELIAPTVEKLTGGRVNMRILSNLATERMVKVKSTIPASELGEGVAMRVTEACSFAEADPYRAVTHNKGIMNGVVGVLLATGNDTRAVEAGAHAYAALSGRYGPLSTWRVKDDLLVGSLEMPLSVGTVGGVVQAHRLARLVLRLLGVETASELAMIAGAVGLACNLGALHALVTGGIRGIQP